MKLISILLLISINLLANWSNSSLKAMSNSEQVSRYKKTAFITYWGGIKRYLKQDGLKGEEMSFQSHNLKESLDIYLYKQKKRLPLVIFFPGVHGDYKGVISPSLINIFEKKSFHLASIPNFLNKKYIKASPKYNSSNSDTLDAEIALEIIEYVIKKIERKNISHISFVGESLGAFLAANIVRVVDDYKGIREKVKNIILLWPPLNISKSLTKFDQKFKETKSTFDSCNFLVNYYRIFKYYVWQDRPQNYSQVDEECLDAMMYHGAFLKSIHESYDVYSEVHNVKEINYPFNFSSFFKVYNPNFLKLLEHDSSELNLSYLVDKWKSIGKDVKIVSSKDDFINDYDDWSKIPDKFIYAWGGHCAPLALDHWESILRNEAL